MPLKTQLADKITKILKDYPEILLTIVYGSAVCGRLRPNSDIDIAVAAASSPLSHYCQSSLQTDLSLSLGREVDLIDLNAVSGPILQQALCTGEVVHKKSKELHAALIKKMWFNQADMMPYALRSMKKAALRFVDD